MNIVRLSPFLASLAGRVPRRNSRSGHQQPFLVTLQVYRGIGKSARPSGERQDRRSLRSASSSILSVESPASARLDLGDPDAPRLADKWRKSNITAVVTKLAAFHGTPTVLAERDDPFEALVTTILSQRTRGENTRIAAERLFRRLKTPRSIAGAPRRTIERLIRPSGFFKAKARHIQAAARDIVDRFHGAVPDTIESLLSLPGVGRKTANCVLVYAFRKPAIPVDVHVHRIANRLGWVTTRHPERTEEALMTLVPRRFWILLNELLVRHGRAVCLPRRPRCRACPIASHCMKKGVEGSPSKVRVG
jgi:endonuclease III